jgi:hypothetical protein
MGLPKSTWSTKQVFRLQPDDDTYLVGVAVRRTKAMMMGQKGSRGIRAFSASLVAVTDVWSFSQLEIDIQGAFTST